MVQAAFKPKVLLRNMDEGQFKPVIMKDSEFLTVDGSAIGSGASRLLLQLA